MTAVLLARTLLGRPLRTALLLGGFGVGVAVMIVLLAIAGAVGEQARGASAVNAGDVVLLPAGIEVEAIQTGSATAFGYRIDHARFLVRQLLGGPRFRERVAAASPVLADAVLYLRRAGSVGPAWQVYATGAVPGSDRAVRGDAAPAADLWRDAPADRRYVAPTQAELLAEIDALHAPPDTGAAAASWAEWQYATMTAPRGDAYLYVSFLLGRGETGAVSLQLRPPGAPMTRYLGPGRAARGGGTPADVRIGRSSFRLVGARYAIALDFTDAATGRSVRGAITLDPSPGLYLSPTEVHGDSGFVSGYVVAALRARGAGWVRVGSAPPLRLDGYTGYHDHNWGTWAAVHWDWGQIASPGGALVYGGLATPALGTAGADGARRPGLASHVAALFDRDGLVAVLRPDGVAYGGWQAGSVTGHSTVRAPGTVTVRARSGDDTLAAVFRLRDAVATRLALGGAAGEPGAQPGLPLYFLQLHGDWSLRARAGGRAVRIDAPGAAETFVPVR